jgi:hypothetical protein
MGIAGPPDIFQVEMLELMINLDLVCNDLDDLLIITKLNLSDQVDKKNKVLTRLREAGLKLTPLQIKILCP